MKVVQQGPKGLICKSIKIVLELIFNNFSALISRGRPMATSDSPLRLRGRYRSDWRLQLGSLRERSLLGGMLLR